MAVIVIVFVDVTVGCAVMDGVEAGVDVIV